MASEHKDWIMLFISTSNSLGKNSILTLTFLQNVLMNACLIILFLNTTLYNKFSDCTCPS